MIERIKETWNDNKKYIRVLPPVFMELFYLSFIINEAIVYFAGTDKEPYVITVFLLVIFPTIYLLSNTNGMWNIFRLLNKIVTHCGLLVSICNIFFSVRNED